MYARNNLQIRFPVRLIFFNHRNLHGSCFLHKLQIWFRNMVEVFRIHHIYDWEHYKYKKTRIRSFHIWHIWFKHTSISKSWVECHFQKQVNNVCRLKEATKTITLIWQDLDQCTQQKIPQSTSLWIIFATRSSQHYLPSIV